MDKTGIDSRLTAIIDCLYRVAAKALIVRDDKLLLSHEGKGKWEKFNFRGLPGGGVDYGENFQAGLERELKEEMGLEISLDQISQAPEKITFGLLRDGIRAGDKNIPTLILYFEVKLNKHQIPQKLENDFEWADLEGLKTANFVSQTAIDREFLIDYLSNNSVSADRKNWRKESSKS